MVRHLNREWCERICDGRRENGERIDKRQQQSSPPSLTSVQPVQHGSIHHERQQHMPKWGERQGPMARSNILRCENLALAPGTDQ